MKKAKKAPLAAALLEVANAMRHTGILPKPAHEKITKRHLGRGVAVSRPLSANQISNVRR
jgi:hypothetical protein